VEIKIENSLIEDVCKTSLRNAKAVCELRDLPDATNQNAGERYKFNYYRVSMPLTSASSWQQQQRC
jgi:hypothetical protein